MRKKVIVPFADGFEEIELVGLVDTMRRGGIEVVTCGVSGKSQIGAHGITILADMQISETSSDGFDMIVLPGGYKNTMTLAENDKVQSLIKEFDLKNKYIGAICAAPIALDRAGVLKDEYTCYPGVSDGIKSSDFIEKAIVESDNVLTSRGPGTAICFGLYIIKKLVGEETAEAVKKEMIVERC
ncbi:MAG: DJ-1/PfpI family protein [Campylobacterales bacterium]|nr:DJ-1/PfpI family protein [Campylobacterales bacterium]